MKRRAFSLIEILAVMAAIAILATIATVGLKSFGGGSSRKDGKGETVVGQTMLRAKDEVCRSNIDQIRQMIYVSSTGGEDGYPAKITDLKGLPKDFQLCPIGKEEYVYNPATGEVHCPHPGHEKY
ncbi:MAG: prepilin-type N-terminal cleavage/methylation domain-containing protein [Fimbriimonadales bacterium]